jgi:3'-phosphoadenosine 5'-phosphosulfate (PAPS) 3'-phosphatase
MRWCVVVLALVSCGGPVLGNAPRPDPGVIAAAAAAAASAATLADPDGAAKHQEQKKDSDEHRPRDVQVDQSVPPDVLDRLDQEQARDGGVGVARDGGVDAR